MGFYTAKTQSRHPYIIEQCFWGMALANSDSTDISWGLQLVPLPLNPISTDNNDGCRNFQRFSTKRARLFPLELLSDSFQYPLNWLVLSPTAISSVACSICCVKAYGIRKTQRGGAERLSVLVRQVHALNHVESTPVEKHVDG